MAFHVGNFGIALYQVPFRWKYAHLFTLQVVFKEDDAAWHDVAVLIVGIDSFLLEFA